jgi:hypothetical protein
VLSSGLTPYCRDQLGAHFRCALGRQILTPGNHIHPKCVADLRDGAADIPETENPQRSPGHVVPDEPLLRSEPFSATRLRALPRIRAQVSSIVGAEV